MKKTYSLLLSCIIALFCCVWCVEPVNAKGFLGTGMCVSDCEEVSSAHVQKLANALVSGDTDTFYNAQGNCGMFSCDDKGFNYYQENNHCDTCFNNATKIEKAFKDNCIAQKCTTNGQVDNDCYKQKCQPIYQALLKGDMQSLEEQQAALNDYISVLDTAITVTDWTCTIATYAAIGLGVALFPGTAALIALGIVGGQLTGAISSDATVNPNVYTGILRAFLAVGGTGCWFCPIFDTIYNVANALASDIYNNLRSLFLALLALGGFGWLLFTVFKFITTIHGPNVGELMTTLFKGLGTIMLVSLFLVPNVSFVTGYLVNIPAMMAIGLSNDILQTSGFSTGNTVSYQTYSADTLMCPGSRSMSNLQSQSNTLQLCTPSDGAAFENKALSRELHDEMSCLLKRVSAELIFGMALGATLITTGLTGGPLGGLIPSFPVLLVGILIFISYFALFVMIPFKLIDLILRICFVVILLPVFIICFAFPATRGYTKKGWELFLSCWVTLIALCIFISFALALVTAVFTP